MNNSIRKISSKNSLFQIIESLKQNRKKRNELNEIFVEGIESIKQALGSDRVELVKIMFREYQELSDWAKGLIAKRLFPEPVQIRHDLYNELSDKDEPSEIMITLRYKKIKLQDCKTGNKAFILIFDRPGDCGNLGSLIRTANAFGVDLFITHGHCVDLFNSKTIRSSLGAVFQTQVVYEESFAVLENWLREQKQMHGLVLAGTDSKGSMPLHDIDLKPPVALVMGNEAKGLSVNFKRILDTIISIPMCGAVNSLNVACAGSIILWNIYKNIEKK